MDPTAYIYHENINNENLLEEINKLRNEEKYHLVFSKQYTKHTTIK